MKFNWNSAIAAVGLLAQDESIKKDIVGKGYRVKRQPKNKGRNVFTITLTEGDYNPEQENDA